jgi:hypothetical protein
MVTFDADDAFRDSLDLRTGAPLPAFSESEAVELALRFAVWLPLDVYEKTPWLAPYAIRSVRTRLDPRVAGPRRDLWGLPDAHGFFTDDNSLLKAAVRGRTVVGPTPYPPRPLTTGLVCCHIWPKTTTEPSLFSFVPNLVWLPRSLAGLSDAHHPSRPPHAVHFALQEASRSRYVSRAGAVAHSWDRLAAPGTTYASGWESFAEVADAGKISRTAQTRCDRMLSFLDAILRGNPHDRRISRRYHAGRGSRIDRSVAPVQELVHRVDLERLRARTALAVT